ncbi:MAG: HD domain-containing protein [Anaeroplasma sp.]
MQLIGEIKAINTSDKVYNFVVIDKNGEVFNLKYNDDKVFSLGELYKFICDVVTGERTSYWIRSFFKVADLDFEEKNQYYRDYYKSSPLSFNASKNEIDKYINKVNNNIIKDILCCLLNKYNDEFYLYPAAAKMHHAYIGGLAYHSIGMLHLADGFIENYPYLDRDYIYAGIMLHDIGKASELSGVVHTEYTLKGQLLGHLVLGAIEIANTAKELGYEETKEVLLLEHMLVSHHGLPQYGSAKKPMTAEALVLWYIDTIDSKFRVLGEELEKIESDSFTDSIGVLDKSKIYKI